LLAAWVLLAALAPRLSLAQGAQQGVIWGAVLGGIVALKNYGKWHGENRG
jgi:hypothetical protein